MNTFKPIVVELPRPTPPNHPYPIEEHNFNRKKFKCPNFVKESEKNYFMSTGSNIIEYYKSNYFIYGWKDNKLYKVLTKYDPSIDCSMDKIITPGKFYDIELNSYHELYMELEKDWPSEFKISECCYNVSYVQSTDEFGRIIIIPTELENGILDLYYTPDINGLYMRDGINNFYK